MVRKNLKAYDLEHFLYNAYFYKQVYCEVITMHRTRVHKADCSTTQETFLLYRDIGYYIKTVQNPVTLDAETKGYWFRYEDAEIHESDQAHIETKLVITDSKNHDEIT